MRIKKASGSVLFLGLFLLPLGGLAQTEDATKVFEQVNNGVVTLVVYGEGKTEIAKGTGFALSEDMIATTYHLVSQAFEVEGLNIKGKKVKVEGILAVDKALDIAFLKV
jgi:hypothetical protein